MEQDRSILTGAACALLGVFPLAALVALCFRFPVPFSGYEGGLRAVPRSLFAVMFFGLTGVGRLGMPFGGFVVLAGIGGAAGAAAHRLTRRDDRWQIWLTLTFALVGDFVVVMILALGS